MFTQATLQTRVFILKRFFCQIQCFDWAKCNSTHTEDNFQFEKSFIKYVSFLYLNYYCYYYYYYLMVKDRASDISRGRGPAKFRYFHEIPRNSQKNAKYREIRQNYFQIHVGKTYLILILAIRPVLFSPNVQIYLDTSSLQRVNNVPKLPGVFR